MAHELWIVKDSTMTNITPLIGTIQWRSNKDELGDEITFDIAFNDDRYFPVNPCDIGDLVILKNGEEITRGIIVEEDKKGRKSIPYTVFDYAFYLNKSNAIYQFNGVAADQAIHKILKDFGVPVGTIVAMPTKIKKIFNNKKVSDIIKEIVKQVEQEQGKKYLMEMREGKFYLEKQEERIIKGKFRLAANLAEHDITQAISNPSRKRSIIDMKNAVQIVSEEKVIAETKNDSLISKYGKLQEVVTIDKEELPKANTIALNTLKDLGKVSEESGLEFIGDDRFRAGRLCEINEPITGLQGTYLITDVNHTISNGIHTMVPGLEAVE
ncbi:hypothetical protein LC040_06085 [Bacillus tianshenii]|nr:hypothetical protein LC040_06085 [Bacillus tianshenii]